MKIAAILVALLYALACQFFALGLAGGGHGWLAPFFGGSLGLIAFPLGAYAALTASSNETRDRQARGAATVLTISANLLVVVGISDEGLQYLDRMQPYSSYWIALWLGGHLPLICARVLRASRREGAL